MSDPRKIYEHGVIFGKFMPVTKGHQRLFDRALEICDKVTIIVCSLSSEQIDGNLRFQWVQKMYPSAHVVHFHEDDVPQLPNDCKTETDFWKTWEDIIVKCAGETPDVLFGGEDYIVQMAQYMNCEHELIDRKDYPISATKIRNSPFEYWDYIPYAARPYFVKKILITGGMSCGKSTVTEKLADYFKTSYVDEVARSYIEDHGFDAHGFPRWAYEHKRAQELAIKHANKLLFVDTDAMITKMYFNMYYKMSNKSIDNIASKEHYDFAILLAPDCPFVKEDGRDFPDRRWEIHGIIKDSLIQRNIPFVEVFGEMEYRFESARNAVLRFLDSK